MTRWREQRDHKISLPGPPHSGGVDRISVINSCIVTVKIQSYKYNGSFDPHSVKWKGATAHYVKKHLIKSQVVGLENPEARRWQFSPRSDREVEARFCLSLNMCPYQ